MTVPRTNNLNLPLLLPGLFDSESLYNEAIALLDVQVSLNLISDTVTDPTSLTPSEGDAYLVPAGATDVWSTQIGDIAVYFGGSWRYSTPTNGMAAWIVSAGRLYLRRSGSWVVMGVRAAAVANLNLTVSGPSIAEVQAIADKIDELLAALRAADLIED